MLKKTVLFPAIKKRDGRLAPFDINKITQAISKALSACGFEKTNLVESITEKVLEELETKLSGHIPQVEEIQDIVENTLIKEGYDTVAKAYILYRAKRSSIREGKTELMDTVDDILKPYSKKPETSDSPSSKMLKIASAASHNFYLSRLIPSSYSKAHREGLLHIHDLGFYSKTFNSIELRLERILKEGFFTGFGYHRAPKRMNTCMALVAIILQSSQNDTFGGQVFSFFDKDLAKATKNFKDTDSEIFQGMEGFVYNLNTLYTRLGSHVPYSCINLGTDTSKQGRRVTQSLLKALEKGLGNNETPLYPQIIFRVKEGINFSPDDPNYDLFIQALKVASLRMNPIFSFADASFNISSKPEPTYWNSGERLTYNTDLQTGRGNIAQITINLPHLALKIIQIKRSLKLSDFYKELEKVIKVAGAILMHRLDIISHLKVKELPFIMGEKLYAGSDKMKPDDEIKKIITESSLSIGFIGLAEALIIFTGKHHGEDAASQELGLEIVKTIEDYIQNLRENTQANFVLSVHPAEHACRRFAELDAKNFGEYRGVADRKFYSNGFHIPVDFKISAKSKIALEAPYHKYCSGGHFTFVRLADCPDYKTVEKIIHLMKEADTGLGGITFSLSECIQCGQRDINNKKCNQCGSTKTRRFDRQNCFMAPLEYFTSEQKEALKISLPQTIS